jgi:transcriptional regulator with XRE-family HTH domain
MVTDLDRARMLSDWIEQRLSELGISDRELSRRGSFSHGNLYQIRGGQLPGLKVLRGIAKGLDVPLSVVLQKAKLEEPIEETPSLRNLLHVAAQLSEDDLERLIRIARTFQDQAKREGKLREVKTAS